MEARDERLQTARRHFFKQCGYGVGKIALASLLGGGMERKVRAIDTLPANPLAARPPHYAPKAKSVIHLFMAGAPSQLDLFDYKPKLAEFEGKSIPPEIIGGQRYAFIRPDAAALGPRFKFARHGDSGAELSEVMPQLATVADDICIIRSMHTDQFNHAPRRSFSTPVFPSRDGRPSVRGPFTAWAPKRASCPLLWSCRPAPASAAAPRTGRAGFCPRFTRASVCATKATRS